LITLFPKAQTQPEELPADPALARLAFLARHLDDLQSIRLVGIPIAFMELPVLDTLPHGTQAITMGLTVALSVGWFYVSRYWFRSRYGRSWSTDDRWDYRGGWSSGMIIGFTIFGLLITWLDQLTSLPAKNHAMNTTWLIGVGAWFGQVVRDRTNLPKRRTVYKFAGLGVVVCLPCILLVGLFGFAAYSRRVSLDIFALMGAVLFGLALFDLWLLRQTFAQIKTQGDETA
jgi:hypothetical protein